MKSLRIKRGCSRSGMETTVKFVLFSLWLVLASSQTVPCDISKSRQSCVLDERYHDYQLATCSSNTDLLQNGFRCENGCTDTCWHLCMVKNFGQTNGTVAENCTCKPHFPSLPSWCFEATGHCVFSNCTVMKYPACSQQEVMQTYLFYSNLCKFLNDFFRYHGCETKIWLDGFRKCVQQYLIDNIISSTVPCGDITNKGVEGFHTCIQTSYGGKSFCELTSESDKEDIRLKMAEIHTLAEAQLPNFNITAGVQYLNCSSSGRLILS